LRVHANLEYGLEELDRSLGEEETRMERTELSGRHSLLDVKWVARTFGVSEQWVYRAVETNEIPHYRLGKLIRFHHRELNAYFKELRGGQ
jgi:excisionase family DNA binding protein